MCGATIDSAQLAVAGRLAYRDSLGLHLRLISGQYLALTRDTTDWPATYQFHAWLAPYSQYLVHLQYGEGDGYMFLDARSGARIYLDDIPVFSPSGGRFAIASGDLEVNYNPNSLSVWRITTTRVEREWQWADSAMTAGWVPRNARWRNDNTLKADYVYAAQGGGNELVAPQPLTLSRTGERWRLVLPAH
jgi:hypothetical protein